MIHQQTRAEHEAQRAMVIAREHLQPTRAARHGVYAKRKPVVAVVPVHRWTLPHVVERVL